jgi:hypothetical protein
LLTRDTLQPSLGLRTRLSAPPIHFAEIRGYEAATIARDSVPALFVETRPKSIA